MCYAAFELLNTVHAERGAFGQGLLSEPSRKAELPQQIAEGGWPNGLHRRVSLHPGTEPGHTTTPRRRARATRPVGEPAHLSAFI